MRFAQFDQRLIQTFRGSSRAAGLVVMAIGGLALIGWIASIPVLKSILPQWVDMKANTAVGLGLAGFALNRLQAGPRFRPLVRGLGLAVALLGLLTLSEYGFGWNLGIDQLLFRDGNAIATSSPGRMSPIAAFNFVLAGTALVALASHRPRYWLAQGLACLTALTALQTLTSYLYGGRPIPGLTGFTYMAIHTAIAFSVLALGLLLAAPTEGGMRLITSDTAGSLVARMLLPAAIVLSLALGWLQVQGEQTRLDPVFNLSVHVLGNTLVLVGLIGYCAWRIHLLDRQRLQAEENLRQAAANLERRVDERTRQLSQVNQSLQREVEDRLRAEAALRESEERLQRTILEAPIPIILHAQDGEILQVNRAWTEITGYSAEEIPTIEEWTDRAYGDRKHQIREAIAQLHQLQARRAAGEHEIVTRSGETRIWDYYSAPLGHLPDGRSIVITTTIDVTEQRQAETERNQFFNLSLDMLSIAGTDGYFKQLNPAWERVLGYTREELLAQPFASFVHPDDLARTQAEAVSHAAGSPSIVFENRYRCKDGSYKWLAWTSVALPEKGLLYAVARDVTDRKRAEESLQEQAHLLDLAYEAIFVRNADDTISYWNHSAEELYGWSRSEALGQVTHTLLQTLFGVPLLALEDTLQQQGHWEGELIHTRRDGRQLIVESRQVLMRDTQGHIQGVLEVNRDITDRKRAEEALRASEERFRATFNQAAVGIAHVGVDGRWLRVNQKFCSIAGYSCDEMMQQTFQDITYPDDLETDLTYMQQVLAGEIETYSMEKRYIRRDGSIVWVNLTPSLVRHADGSPDYFISVIQDISDRKAAEAALHDLNETLEQRVEERTAQLAEANQELKRFTYSISHDLRSPLRAIRGLVEALVEDNGDQLDELGREYIEHIVSSTRRMDVLIQDLLAYSRLTQAEITLQPVDLATLVQDVLDQLEPERQAKQAQITLDLPLPQVIAQPTLLSQVLTNLLTNALKYVAPEVQPQIHIWAEPRANRVRLWVADNGIGIAPEYWERIFGVFERLHTADSYPGTGVGLAIAQKGMERMGGHIGVESQPGQGSQFWIELFHA